MLLSVQDKKKEVQKAYEIYEKLSYICWGGAGKGKQDS